jgi:hypothetical protein
MKSWTVLLIGVAAGVACVLIAKKLLEGKSGVGGMGDVEVPPPNSPWFNLGVKPMDYAYTGWNPPEAYKLESQKLAQQRLRRPVNGNGMSEYAPLPYSMSYPLALTQYPQYPTSPQRYVVEDPTDWRSPQIDARFSGEMDAF